MRAEDRVVLTLAAGGAIATAFLPPAMLGSMFLEYSMGWASLGGAVVALLIFRSAWGRGWECHLLLVAGLGAVAGSCLLSPVLYYLIWGTSWFVPLLLAGAFALGVFALAAVRLGYEFLKAHYSRNQAA